MDIIEHIIEIEKMFDSFMLFSLNNNEKKTKNK
jgi:hypothetical protein